MLLSMLARFAGWLRYERPGRTCVPAGIGQGHCTWRTLRPLRLPVSCTCAAALLTPTQHLHLVSHNLGAVAIGPVAFLLTLVRFQTTFSVDITAFLGVFAGNFSHAVVHDNEVTWFLHAYRQKPCLSMTKWMQRTDCRWFNFEVVANLRISLAVVHNDHFVDASHHASFFPQASLVLGGKASELHQVGFYLVDVFVIALSAQTGKVLVIGLQRSAVEAMELISQGISDTNTDERLANLFYTRSSVSNKRPVLEVRALPTR